MWKTKEVIRPNGSKVKHMICLNSKPSESKWGEFAPEDGVCENWVAVSDSAIGILCFECTARSIGKVRT